MGELMSHAILERLQVIKTKTGTAGNAKRPDFALRGSLAVDALAVEIEGFGLLAMPLALAAAAALGRLTVPAPFGLRDKTLIDVRVRDSGELDANSVQLRWRDGVLPALLAEVADKLGLEGLTAHLHKLLVYGSGQFFKTHQDTEKLPGMVATLVLILPCAHLGGELRVALGDDERRFGSQQVDGREIRWFAFYADCRHEILAVEEGYRIALCFDLVIDTEHSLPAPPVDARLQQGLRERFALPHAASAAAASAAAASTEPLVILLDHEYSENGLRWSLLKGIDRTHVAQLRAAGDSLGLVASLALAELMQIYSAEVDGTRFQGRQGYQRRVSEADVVPGDLIDQEMSLNFWVDSDENILRDATLKIPADAVLSLTPTDARFLVSSEYEGYMGNYGETIEHWYRRAALVIESPVGAMRTQFVVNFANALAQLKAMTRLADSDSRLRGGVQAVAQTLADQARAQGRAVFADYVEIALHLADSELARDLLAPFPFVDLLAQDAPLLSALEKSFGTPWVCALLDLWTAPKRDEDVFSSTAFNRPSSQAPSAMRLWPVKLTAFLHVSGLSAASTASLFRALYARLVRCDIAREKTSSVQRNSNLGTHIEAFCQLAVAARQSAQDTVLRTLIDHALLNSRIYPLLELDVLVLACAPFSAEHPAANPLAAQICNALQVEIALLERAPNDHTLRNIEWPVDSQEALAVKQWAESASSAALVLPLAEALRRALEWRLRAADAPLIINTIKQGSPHKLQLRKPANLHEQDRERRLQLLVKLARISLPARSADFVKE